MSFLGIDPGATGALAWIDDNGQLLRVEDLPMVEVKVGKTKRRRLASQLLMLMLQQDRPLHAYVEEVGPRPKEGAVGAFAFGKTSGLIEGVLAGMQIPLTTIRPQTWMRSLRVPADKGGARQRAMACFPAHAASFKRVKDDGRAESALIGLFGVQRASGAIE